MAVAWPETFEEHYLRGADPRAQSGFRGDEQRWERARRPILRAVDRDGTFLDVGCANGYLMESVVRWASHRIEPYGLDFSAKLVDLARRRLPAWADRIFLGDALGWEPPRRFDFVRTELCYVPAERERELVERLLERVVAPGGTLILCGYGSPRRGVPPHPVRAAVRSWGHDRELELEAADAEGGGRILELVAIRADASLP